MLIETFVAAEPLSSTGREPAASEGDDDVPQVRDLVTQLEADRALARDDEQVVERGNQRRATLRRDCLRVRERACFLRVRRLLAGLRYTA